MKTCWRLAFLALILTTCWAATAWAETRYITDQLVVSLRESPQNSSASSTYLKTDTPVIVIDALNDFVKVIHQHAFCYLEFNAIRRHLGLFEHS